MADDIASLLRLDPLAVAEGITGRSYKDDDSTIEIGLALHLTHNERKREALTAAGDTHYGSNLAEQLAVFQDLGFVPVLNDPFFGKSRAGEPAPAESYIILWHGDGILATVESYQTTGRNSAKIYYNWIPKEGIDRWSITSSGGFRENDEGTLVWVGDHDAREGLRHKFNRLRENGTFLSQWIERPFLWLVTYTEDDVEGYSYKDINAERISRLPHGVRDAIGKDA